VSFAPSIRAALTAFAVAGRAMFGARLRELAVFGSHARGEARLDSDVDVVVVVDDLTGAEGRVIAHLAGDVVTAHDVVISAFTASTERMTELRRRERAIAAEIARDGVAL
jgi:uncharacterized protein